jgi:hypothetical protein
VFDLSVELNVLRMRQAVKPLAFHRAGSLNWVIPLLAYMRRIHWLQ